MKYANLISFFPSHQSAQSRARNPKQPGQLEYGVCFFPLVFWTSHIKDVHICNRRRHFISSY